MPCVGAPTPLHEATFAGGVAPGEFPPIRGGAAPQAAGEGRSLLRLVRRADHHREPPAPRVRVHLPLRVLLLDHPRGCGDPEEREEDSPPEGSP